MRRNLRLFALAAAALGIVSACAGGHAASTARATPTTPGSPSLAVSKMTPPTNDDLAVIGAYLRAVMAGDCKAAQRLMLPTARRSSDLCSTRSRIRVRIDAWRLGPRALWASGTVVEGVPINLHFVSGPDGRGPARWTLYTVPLMQIGDSWRVEPGVAKLVTSRVCFCLRAGRTR